MLEIPLIALLGYLSGQEIGIMKADPKSARLLGLTAIESEKFSEV
jgi:hypothetical protein